jgi:hypothetical protein
MDRVKKCVPAFDSAAMLWQGARLFGEVACRPARFRTYALAKKGWKAAHGEA